MRDTGLSYAQIGQVLGISKQRVGQFLTGYPRKKAPLKSRRVLTVGDVGQLLGIHNNTVRRWSDQGLLKYFCIGNRGDRRYKREDIERFIKERMKGD